MDIHPDWLDSYEAREALARMGGIEAALENPVRLLELIGEIRDAADDPRLTSWLKERHLTLAEITELVATVAINEPPADLLTSSPGLRTQGARAAATLLYLRGVEPDVAARILDVPEAHVVDYLRSRGASPQERPAVQLHFAGATVVEIVNATGLSKPTVYELLERAGLTPNRKSSAPPAGRRQRIVSLRQQGKSYAEIRELTGATTNQVRMALRAGAAKGLLPDYGKREQVSA